MPVKNRHRIGKKHVANFFDLPLAEQAECWQVADKVQEWLQVRYQPNGFTVGLNIGAAAGQKFAHASIQIIPRYVGDVPNPGGGVRNVVRR